MLLLNHRCHTHTHIHTPLPPPTSAAGLFSTVHFGERLLKRFSSGTPVFFSSTSVKLFAANLSTGSVQHVDTGIEENQRMQMVESCYTGDSRANCVTRNRENSEQHLEKLLLRIVSSFEHRGEETEAFFGGSTLFHPRGNFANRSVWKKKQKYFNGIIF